MPRTTRHRTATPAPPARISRAGGLGRAARVSRAGGLGRAAVAVLAVAALLAVSACVRGPVRQVALSEKQTLTVWGMGEEGQRLAELADDFERRHPAVTVDVTPV
ncbi:hypothetical protein ABZ070_17350, partial [Streptomyces sp. NPDC006283]